MFKNLCVDLKLYQVILRRINVPREVGYSDKLLFRIFFICMFGAGAVILAHLSTDRNVLLSQVLEKTVCIQTLTSLTLTSSVTTSLSLFPHLQMEIK